MKRRRFMQALAAAPAAPALLAQRPAPAPSPSPEDPKLDASVEDAAADPMPGFFTPPQFAALRRLSALLMPPADPAPGAIEAGAPEFLDFLIASSSTERQELYRAGLDALNQAARTRFSKAFDDVDDAQAGVILAPLREPWTYELPADPLARFLHVAKQDVRTATANSREYQAVAPQGGGRRFGGRGFYWYPLD